MARTMETRVTESFKDSPHEDVTKYLEWLHATIEALSQNLRRTLTLMLVLMAAFELINGSPNTIIAIGSFKLSSGSIVAIFIPAIVAFLLFQAVTDTNQLDTLQGAFTKAFSIWSSEAERNDLDVLLLPSILYWKAGFHERRENRTWWITIHYFLKDGISGVVLIGTIAFQIQAYYVLYPRASHYIALWVISILVTAFCSIGTIVQIVGRW